MDPYGVSLLAGKNPLELRYLYFLVRKHGQRVEAPFGEYAEHSGTIENM